MALFISARSVIGQGSALTIALLFIALAGGCGPRAAALPTGTFTTTIPAEAFAGDESMAGYVGDWQLTFAQDARYTLVNKGVDIVRGTFAIDGERITFTEESGLLVPGDGGGRFVYTWALDEGQLQFQPIDDPVAERKIIMSNQPWTASS